ncbi:hypothetical protein MICRO80W_20012 [Micrococcus luteus]|nr:hypothetical protein MICRO80W_20012 [Micrococcus luteus]
MWSTAQIIPANAAPVHHLFTPAEHSIHLWTVRSGAVQNRASRTLCPHRRHPIERGSS